MRNTVPSNIQVANGTATTAGYIRAYSPWLFVAFIAYIYLWYLQYKFTGHPGSVQLFTTLTDWLGFHGHEKFMRIGVGSMELTATTLLVIPRTQIFGAALSLCIMTGAIFFHTVSPLGIDPYGDGGVLFKQELARPGSRRSPSSCCARIPSRRLWRRSRHICQSRSGP